MKSLFVSMILVCSFAISLSASPNHKTVIKKDSTNKISINQLLEYYYKVKDALVNSSSSNAAAHAGGLLNAIQSINVKTLTDAEQKAFMSIQDKLSSEAKSISQSKELPKQRIYFASLSDNFYTLAKEVKLSTKPIYRDYCPMKKKYWLSSESTIKNPYFGKAMPTCGEVKETLK